MCGPTASIFWFGLTIFGVLFLSLLAILIKHDYPYVGEWFDAKGEPGQPAEPLEDQRAKAVQTLWSTVGIYGGLAALSGAFIVLHKVRGAL